KTRWKIMRFRNYPDAGLGPVRAGHHAAQVTVPDADARGGGLLGAHLPRRSAEQRGDRDRRHAKKKTCPDRHDRLLPVIESRAVLARSGPRRSAISMHKRPSSATRHRLRFHTRDTNRLLSVARAKQAISSTAASDAFVALFSLSQTRS